MKQRATILDIIEAGLWGNQEQVRAYTEVLIERIEAEQDTPQTEQESDVLALRRLIERKDTGERGRVITPAATDDLLGKRVAVLPAYEMWALVTVLKKSVDHFRRHICDDIDFESLVPNLADRQAMMKQYHDWNGDPEVWEEDLATGGLFAQCRYWTYGAMLAYFAHQLAPDIEQELREAGISE